MTFHDFGRGRMTVMDGKRCVAVCRPILSGGYMLRVYGGSWVDYRARSQGMFPGKFPELLLVPKVAEAREMLKGLVS